MQTRSYSEGLRGRIVSSVEGGMSKAQAARTVSVQTHQALRAERFTDSAAVNTHFAFSDSGYATGFADLKSALCDMDGGEHIRDRAIPYWDSRDAEVYDLYKQLFQDCGIRATLLVDLRSDTLNRRK